MKLKNYIKPLIVAGGIALAGCDNSGQAPEKTEQQVNNPNKIELAVTDSTRKQVTDILRNHCNPIQLTEKEKRIVNIEREKKNSSIEQLRENKNNAIAILRTKKNEDIQNLRNKRDSDIKQNPSQRADIESKYFEDKQKIENEYFANKDII